MIASAVAVGVNTCLNYCLIFGNFGFPCLGVNGAAVATVVSRFVEMSINVIYVIVNRERLPFAKHLFDSYKVPANLVKDILSKGFPLVINEFFYSLGMVLIVQCYSVRGISAVAAFNIVNTIANVCFVVNIACGNAIAIIVGQKLGAGKIEEARETDIQIIVFSFIINILIGLLLFVFCPLLPRLYNTTEEIKLFATSMLKVYGTYMPIASLYMASYFTIRSGGNTALTFFFDGFYTACISYPLAFVLSRFTSMNIVHLYMCVMYIDIFKVMIGLKMIADGKWAKNIVG